VQAERPNQAGRTKQRAVRKSPSLIKLYPKPGQVGKENMRAKRFFSSRLPLFAAATLLLQACADQPITFAGTLTPQAGTCDAASRAVLVKRGQYIQFAPRQGVLVLTGRITQDGRASAGLDTVGADRKPYHLSFGATLAGQTMEGEFITPRCRYTATLQRVD
jgi:hypothetical protein